MEEVETIEVDAKSHATVLSEYVAPPEARPQQDP
jgi:hypothetical protein